VMMIPIMASLLIMVSSLAFSTGHIDDPKSDMSNAYAQPSG
jgi:hypothetical protein